MISQEYQDVNRELIRVGAGYMKSMILIAGCELDLFSKLIATPGQTLTDLCDQYHYSSRPLDYLLGSLVAQGYLEKRDGKFYVKERYHSSLDLNSPTSVAHMLRHQGSCLRGWSQLAYSVAYGAPAPYLVGVNGEEAEGVDFILAMNDIAETLAPKVAARLKELGLLNFTRMLDLGGASGTYTRALLDANAQHNATAIIFDRPVGIEEARAKMAETRFADRVELYPGDFYVDPYPSDVDFVWISAIIHQQDEAQTQRMFERSYDALRDGGLIAIRDVYINDAHDGPEAATTFGLNMSVRTRAGMVYEARRVLELLTDAGFKNARLAAPADDMTAVIVAKK